MRHESHSFPNPFANRFDHAKRAKELADRLEETDSVMAVAAAHAMGESKLAEPAAATDVILRPQRASKPRGRLDVNGSTRDNVGNSSGSIMAREYEQKGFALSYEVFKRKQAIEAAEQDQLLIMKSYLHSLREQQVDVAEIERQSQQAHDWIKEQTKALSAIGDKTTYITDMDGVVFIDFTKPDLIKDSVVAAPQGSARRQEQERQAAAYTTQQGRGKAYQAERVQTSAVEYHLAELGVYEDSEHKIARILNAMMLSEHDPERLHLFIDDKTDILTAVYNFYQRYPHLFAGQLALYICESETGIVKACRFRLATTAEKAQGLPMYVMADLSSDPEITSKARFFHEAPPFVQHPTVGSEKEFEEQEELAALWMQHQQLRITQHAKHALLQQQKAYDEAADVGGAAGAGEENLASDALPEHILAGTLKAARTPVEEVHLVNAIAAISKDIEKLAKQGADGKRIDDIRDPDHAETILVPRALLRVGRFFEIFDAELHGAQLVERDLVERLDDVSLPAYDPERGYLPILAAVHSAIVLRESGFDESVGPQQLLAKLLNVLPPSANLRDDLDEGEMVTSVHGGSARSSFDSMYQGEDSYADDYEGEGVCEQDANSSSECSLSLLNEQSNDTITDVSILVAWLREKQVSIANLFLAADDPTCPMLIKQFKGFALRIDPNLMGGVELPSLKRLMTKPVKASEQTFKIHGGKVILVHGDDDTLSAVIEDLRAQGIDQPFCFTPMIDREVMDHSVARYFQGEGGDAAYAREVVLRELHYNLTGVTFPHNKVVRPAVSWVLKKSRAAMARASMSSKMENNMSGEYAIERYCRGRLSPKSFDTPFRQDIWLERIAAQLLDGFIDAKQTDEGQAFFKKLSQILLLEGTDEEREIKVLGYWQLLLLVLSLGQPHSIVVLPPGYNAAEFDRLLHFFTKKLVFTMQSKVVSMFGTSVVPRGLVRPTTMLSIDFRQTFIRSNHYDDLYFNLEKLCCAEEVFKQQFAVLMPEFEEDKVVVEVGQVPTVAEQLQPLLGSDIHAVLEAEDPFIDYLLMPYVRVATDMRTPYRYTTTSKDIDKLLKEVVRLEKLGQTDASMQVAFTRHLMAFFKLVLLPTTDDLKNIFGMELAKYNLCEAVDRVVVHHTLCQSDVRALNAKISDFLDRSLPQAVTYGLVESVLKQLLECLHQGLTSPAVFAYSAYVMPHAHDRSVGYVPPIEHLLAPLLPFHRLPRDTRADSSVSMADRSLSSVSLPSQVGYSQQAYDQFVVSRDGEGTEAYGDIFGFEDDDLGPRLFFGAFAGHPALRPWLRRYMVPFADLTVEQKAAYPREDFPRLYARGDVHVTTPRLRMQCAIDLVRTTLTATDALAKQKIRIVHMLLGIRVHKPGAAGSEDSVPSIGEEWMVTPGEGEITQKDMLPFVLALQHGLLTLDELQAFCQQLQDDLTALITERNGDTDKPLRDSMLVYNYWNRRIYQNILTLFVNPYALEKQNLDAVLRKHVVGLPRPKLVEPLPVLTVLEDFKRTFPPAIAMTLTDSRWHMICSMVGGVCDVGVVAYKFMLPTFTDKSFENYWMVYTVQGVVFVMSSTALTHKVVHVAKGLDPSTKFSLSLGGVYAGTLLFGFLTLAIMEPPPVYIINVSGLTTSRTIDPAFALYYDNLVQMATVFANMGALNFGVRLLAYGLRLGDMFGSIIAKSLVSIFKRLKPILLQQTLANQYLIIKVIIAFCVSYLAFDKGSNHFLYPLAEMLNSMGKLLDRAGITVAGEVFRILINPTIGVDIGYIYMTYYLVKNLRGSKWLLLLAAVPALDVVANHGATGVYYANDPELPAAATTVAAVTTTEAMVSASSAPPEDPGTPSLLQRMLTWLFDNTSAFRWGVALLSMVVISLMQGLVMRWQAHGDALASHRQRVPDWGSCSSGNRHRIGATESGDDHDQVLDAHVGQFEESKTAKAVVVVNH